MRRFSIAALAAAALIAAIPSGAGAATQLGETFTPGDLNSCLGGPDWEVLQTGRASGLSYAAPSDGVLTSWSFEADDAVQTVMTLRVFRPTGTAHQYQVIADGGELRTIPASSGLHTVPTQISVKAGDYIGIRSTSGECGIETGNAADTWDFRSATATPVGATGNFAELSGGIWDISAQLEPDADADGFGDETQDQCPTDPSTQGPCPGPGPITTPTGPAPTLPGGAPATCRGLTATIAGTPADDVRRGTPGRDVIAGLGGNDTLSGLAGNDVICGGPGNDTVTGGRGKDNLNGQSGNDRLNGSAAKDKLKGKAGNDVLKGGPARDILKGGKGKDKLLGQGGSDKLVGQGGKDTCFGGGGGNDTAKSCEKQKSI